MFDADSGMLDAESARKSDPIAHEDSRHVRRVEVVAGKRHKVVGGFGQKTPKNIPGYWRSYAHQTVG
jgi:hypothetical protein